MKTAPVAIDHLNLTVRNFAESERWYRDVFGFEKVEEGMERDGPWGVLRAGDTMLCIYESPNRAKPFLVEKYEKVHCIYHFSLRIRDRAQWERTVKEQGIQVGYGGPIRYPHSTSWYVKDPTGHEIEVTFWNDDQIRFG